MDEPQSEMFILTVLLIASVTSFGYMENDQVRQQLDKCLLTTYVCMLKCNRFGNYLENCLIKPKVLTIHMIQHRISISTCTSCRVKVNV